MSWTMAPCATARLYDTELDSNQRWLVISGSGVQCAPAVSDGGIRLAVYPAGQSTGTAAGYNVRLFPSTDPGATRGFGAAIARPVAGEYGVCVLAGDNVRITCARVTVSRLAPRRLNILMQTLEPSDPLVVKPVEAGTYTGTVLPPVRPGEPGSGVCGSCF
ncbi:hypothetical protein AB0G04_43820 [Actinoplanes sp. NPDC023801]|uniref:hypothetical protein n=1 Tax=Actinoplanes sp. NPDC023801 TaxID=3154595 RepID=UPI0033F7A791